MTYWHTTFGRIEVVEITLEEYGKTVRPFLMTSCLSPRGCSTPLQRRLTDFAADVPFHDVPKKLKEHYGFELCVEIIRKTTLHHATQIETFTEKVETLPDQPGIAQLLCEADGGMVPIVTMSSAPDVKDKRKTRRVSWKEARLCFSRDVRKITACFRATLKSTEMTGDMWFSSAVEAGLGTSTQIHCIGDGARWIKEQASRIFGGQGNYLVDFYHVSEYLASASEECEGVDSKRWLKEQQCRLRSGDLYLVLQELEKFMELGKKKEAMKTCYRYLTNRLDQLDYLGAILEGLPIGSGEIESGHRHVVQKRMKRSGSWWKEENAEKMLQLLTLRANGLWEDYWTTQKKGDFFEQAA